MSDIAVGFLLLGVGLAALVVPLVVYALMPEKLLSSASAHGRYAGLGTAEPANSASGHAPAVVIGSLQGQAS
jgi:hypothetical protein